MSTTTTDSFVTDLVSRIQMTSSLLCRDIECMDDATLGKVFGEKARTGFDVAYEVATVNRMVAGGLRGNTLSEEPPKGWMRAPQSACSKNTILAELQTSVDDVISALTNARSEDFDRIADTPLGQIPLRNFAGILPGHMMYHSGQLNYIQTLCGDDEFHWG
jgi:hypothetical protein